MAGGQSSPSPRNEGWWRRCTDGCLCFSSDWLNLFQLFSIDILNKTRLSLIVIHLHLPSDSIMSSIMIVSWLGVQIEHKCTCKCKLMPYIGVVRIWIESGTSGRTVVHTITTALMICRSLLSSSIPVVIRCHAQQVEDASAAGPCDGLVVTHLQCVPPVQRWFCFVFPARAECCLETSASSAPAPTWLRLMSCTRGGHCWLEDKAAVERTGQQPLRMRRLKRWSWDCVLVGLSLWLA